MCNAQTEGTYEVDGNNYEPNCEESKPDYRDFYQSKYQLISPVAYLIGVEKIMFENEHEPPQMEIFNKLNLDKSSRRVRHLSRLRTAFLKNYYHIRDEFSRNFRNISTVPDLIPVESWNQLTEDGINIYHGRPDCNQYLTEINQAINNNINNCKRFFPDWVSWEYVKSLFMMPDGFKPAGLQQAVKDYNSDWNRFPYQCYINWKGKTDGNILYSDDKFVRLLYDANQDYFGDMSLVRDVGNIALQKIEQFVRNSGKIVMVVDCENSDPIKLSAALSRLSQMEISKIKKIFLFDSEYTTASWKVMSKDWSILSTLGSFQVDHVVVPRVNEHKSQVDITLAAVTCKEVYGNQVDSIILVSSDSDYWALMRNLQDARFFVMVEKIKCGSSIKDKLNDYSIPYCYLDDFNTSESYNIKIRALLQNIQKKLDDMIHLNTRSLLDHAIGDTWVKMTTQERDTFYSKYLAKMRVEVSDRGDIRLRLGD